MSSPASTLLLQGLLGVKKKGGRVEQRHFILYSDRLDYYISKEDAEAGRDPRGWIALDDIVECEESEDGFNLRLGPDRGLELKVKDNQDLQKWLDTLEPLLEEDESDKGPPGDDVNRAAVEAARTGAKAATLQRADSVLTTSLPTPSTRPISKMVSPVPSPRHSPRPDSLNTDQVKIKLKAAANSAGITDWKKLFNEYDKDHSGAIDLLEFTSLVRKGAKIAPAALTDAEISYIFDSAVQSGDGKMNYERDFLSWLGTHAAEKHVDAARNAAIDRVANSKAAHPALPREKDEQLIRQMKQKLKAAAYTTGKHDWSRLFKDFDRDHSGTIDVNEFKQLIRKGGHISKDTISDEELTRLFHLIDDSSDGYVSYEKGFLPWLSADTQNDEADASAKSGSIPDPYRKPEVVRQMENEQKQAMFESIKRKLRAVSHEGENRDWGKIFRENDKDKSGFVDLKEFQLIVRKSGQFSKDQVTDDDLQELFKSLDGDVDGKISYETDYLPWITAGHDLENEAKLDEERKKIARATQQKMEAQKKQMREQTLEEIKKKLKATAYSNGKKDWHKLFKDADKNNSGNLDREEFKAAIRKGAKVTADIMSDADVTALFKSVDESHDGEISIDEFLTWLLGGENHDADNDPPKSNVAGSPVGERGKERTKAEKEAAKAERAEKEKAVIEQVKKKLKAAALTNGKRDFAKLFRDVDTDNSGEINAQEFKAILRKAGKVTADVLSDNDLKRLFDSLDVTGDGNITYDNEFLPWLAPEGEDFHATEEETCKSRVHVKQKTAQMNEEKAKKRKELCEMMRKKLRAASYDNGQRSWNKLFKDLKGGNEVSFEAFRNIVRKAGKVSADMIGDKDLERVFREIDADGQGSLSTQEIMSWLGGEDELSVAAKQAEEDRSKKAHKRLQQERKNQKDEEKSLKRKAIALAKQKLKAAAFSDGKQDLAKLFRDHDRDNSGMVDFTEFNAIIRKTGKLGAAVFSDQDMLALWDAVNLDGDEHIHFEDEFVPWLLAEDGDEKDMSEAAISPSSDPGYNKVLREGQLEIFRAGKMNPRYFKLYQDCFEYFALSPTGEPTERRGQVAVADIAKFMVIPEGHNVHITFSIVLTGPDGKSLDLHVPRKEDVTSWRSAFDALLGKQLGGMYVQTDSAFKVAADSPTARAREGNADGMQSVTEAPRFVGLKKQDAKDVDFDAVVADGPIGVMKKNNLESRYLVLFRDRFECYTTKEIYQTNGQPRSRVSLKDVQDVEELHKEGFNVLLQDRSYQLRTGAADFDKWVKAFSEVFDFESSGSSASPEVVSAHRSSTSDDGTKKKRKVKEGMDASTPSTSPSPPPGTQEQGLSADKSQSLAPANAKDLEGLIHQGTLALDRKGKSEPRHFAVFKNRVEYYVNANDMASGVDPRGRVLLKDIQEIDVLDMGFAVHLAERTLTLTASSQADFEVWQAAWGEALEGRDQQDEDVSKRGEPDKQKDAVHEGTLTIEQGKKCEPRYVVLYQDRIDIYADGTDLLHGIKPQLIIFKKDISDLEIQDDGFKVEAPGQDFFLRIREPRDHDAWLAGFSKVFGEEDEQQLPNSSQLQPSGSPSPQKSQPRNGPHIIWQSMLEVQERGRSVWKYFALFEDSLASFKAASDLAQGHEPEGRIPLNQVQDVKVGNHGFVLQFQEFNLAFRVSTEPGALSAWLAALHQVLNFSDSPISIPAPSSAATKTLSSTERILHQGVMSLTEEDSISHTKTTQLRYLVLYADRVEIFPDVYTHMDGKQLPATKVLFSEIKDFQVIDNSFSLHFQGRHVVLRSSGQGSYVAWRRAWGEVEPVLEKFKMIHQGPLEIVNKSSHAMQHCCLYNDRLEYYNNTADAEAGQRRRGVIPVPAIRGVQERDGGFILQMEGTRMEFRTVGQDDPQPWISFIRQVLDDFAKKASQPNLLRPAAALGTPCFGSGDAGCPVGTPGFGSTAFDGSWNLEGQLQSPNAEKTSVLALKFPTAPWPAPPNFNPELRKSLLAIGFLRCRVRNILFRDGSVVAEMMGSKDAIEEFRRQYSGPNTANFNVMGYALGDTALVKLDGHEVSQPEVDLDAPLHSAVLGIQHGGCLSNKFFVLYRDRLDYFDDKKDAVSGLRPLGRIALSEVSEYEAYGSGFILKLMGRSIGLHVPQDDKPEVWTKYLSQALASNIPAKAKNQRDSWGMGRFKTEAAKAKAKATAKAKGRDTTPRRDTTPTSKRDTTPTSKRDTTPTRDVSPSKPHASRAPRMSATFGAGSASAQSPLSRSPTATVGVNSLGDWVSTRMNTRREWNGGTWNNREVADKILEKKSTIVPPKDLAVTDKLTGDRSQRALSARRGSNDTRPIVERAEGSLATSRSSPDITGKVNEAGRCYKLPVGPDRMEVRGKINEVGKDKSGWLRKGGVESTVGQAEKIGSLNSSRSAPASNGEVRTAGVCSTSFSRIG